MLCDVTDESTNRKKVITGVAQPIKTGDYKVFRDEHFAFRSSVKHDRNKAHRI